MTELRNDCPTDILNISTSTQPSLAFAHVDPLAPSDKNPTFVPTDPKDIQAAYPELKRKLYAAANEGDEGELAISLPVGTIKRSGQGADGMTPAATPAAVVNSDLPEFESIIIKIEYELVNPKEGIRFVGAQGDGGEIPHVYTSSSSSDAARCWVPCIDTLWDRCTWELQLSVPRSLELTAEGDEEGGNIVETLPVIAVASGELVEQFVHPHSSTQIVFHYAQSTPASVQHIGFAVGPFHILDLSPAPLDDAPVIDDGQAKLHAFCLPGSEADLLHSVAFVRQALDFYITESGSFPFNSYKLVFIDDSDHTAGVHSVHNTAAMTIFPSDLLHPPSIIEQGIETRQILSHALATQWIGINIIQKTWADTWLINGLALHMASQFLRQLLGVNEYRFRLKKDVMRCTQLDLAMPPICEPGVDHPPEADVLAFVNLKAPLVLHILDVRLLKSGTSHGLTRILPKLFLSAISGELKDAVLSTNQFMRICRKISGTDLATFTRQWIYGSGCPKFIVNQAFDGKHKIITLTLTQESPAYAYSVNPEVAWESIAHVNPVKNFEGQMTFRVHEPDGTPYEHVLDLRGETWPKIFQLPFNTKYKRVRPQSKRFQIAKQAALANASAAAARGEAQPPQEEDHLMIDMTFGMDLWEDEDERLKWRATEYTKEDYDAMGSATYEWIRVDADFEWICSIEFEQTENMWVSQLQRDRDVIAQLEVRALLSELVECTDDDAIGCSSAG